MTDQHYKRQFINDRGTAFIETSIAEPCPYNTWAYLSMSDCNRKIELEFGYTTEEDRQERVAKLDLIIKHLIEFQRDLQKAVIPEKPDRKPPKTTYVDELLAQPTQKSSILHKFLKIFS